MCGSGKLGPHVNKLLKPQLSMHTVFQGNPMLDYSGISSSVFNRAYSQVSKHCIGSQPESAR